MTAASISKVEIMENILDKTLGNKGVNIDLDIKNKQELKSLLTTALLKDVDLTSSTTKVTSYGSIIEKILDKTLGNKGVNINLDIKNKQELKSLLTTAALSDTEKMEKILDKILEDKEVNINLGIQNREELVAVVNIVRSTAGLSEEIREHITSSTTYS
ncbi:hypothetical protein [Wolbachia endosymbiont of Chironomus riparius]|uniref:hypothetical protein n=1 Tax=Wolbachia endosymbiont of Chironomus riparius TaxID=2883238 RepID=UPI00209E123E|nr:hypothetical protein [Wolbachia endosymbiont of Chironomus riparius]